MEILRETSTCQTEELCKIIKNFEFLGKYETNFSITRAHYTGMSNPGVTFYDYITKISIIIIGHDFLGKGKPGYSINIIRKMFFGFDFNKEKWGFDPDNYYEIFESEMQNEKLYPLEIQAKFIEKHLMPVITGEMWIDELLAQTKKQD